MWYNIVMKYKVITFKSKKLKNDIIDISDKDDTYDAFGSSSDSDSARMLKGNFHAADPSSEPETDNEPDADEYMSRKEKKRLKKEAKLQRKADKKAVKKAKKRGDIDYNEPETSDIDDDFEEEELSDDQKKNIEIKALLNADGFYDIVQPEDADEEIEGSHVPKKIIVAVAGAVAIILIIAIIFILQFSGTAPEY